MSEIMLFHGSEYIIRNPEYGKGYIHNDYGQGFYCTEHIELAKEWACTKDHGGYANIYSFDMDGLEVLNLSDDNYHILNWLAVLLDNRIFSINSSLKREARDYIVSEFMPNYKNADIMIGYRADDSYFSFANAFISNSISLRQLSKAMHLGNLGEQIVLKSKIAFDHIRFTDYVVVDWNEYYEKRKARDDEARIAFQSEKANIADDIYLIDIIRHGWRDEYACI